MQAQLPSFTFMTWKSRRLWYSTSNIKAWSWFLHLQTANCSRIERNWIYHMERFLYLQFSHLRLLKDIKLFFSDNAPFQLNGCVNKQNMCYWLADNPDWHIRDFADCKLNRAGLSGSRSPLETNIHKADVAYTRNARLGRVRWNRTKKLSELIGRCSFLRLIRRLIFDIKNMLSPNFPNYQQFSL